MVSLLHLNDEVGERRQDKLKLPYPRFQTSPLRFCGSNCQASGFKIEYNEFESGHPFCYNDMVSSEMYPITFAYSEDNCINVIHTELTEDGDNHPAKVNILALLCLSENNMFSDVAERNPIMRLVTIGDVEFLFVTGNPTCILWNVTDIWNAIYDLTNALNGSVGNGDDPIEFAYDEFFPAPFVFAIENGDEITDISSHPDSPVIVLSFISGEIRILRYCKMLSLFERVASIDTGRDPITAVEIMSLKPKGAVSFEPTSPQVKRYSLLVNFTGRENLGFRPIYARLNLSEASRTSGFVGRLIVKFDEAGDVTYHMSRRRTREAVFLTKTISRDSTLQVDTKEELLGYNYSQILEDYNVSGVMKPNFKPPVVEPMWFNPWEKVSSEQDFFYDLTEADLSRLENFVTLLSFSSQVVLCRSTDFQPLCYVTAESLFEVTTKFRPLWSDDLQYYTGNVAGRNVSVPLHLNGLCPEHRFGRYIYIPELSLICMVSGLNLVVFLRLTTLLDGTVGLRVEGAWATHDPKPSQYEENNQTYAGIATAKLAPANLVERKSFVEEWNSRIKDPMNLLSGGESQVSTRSQKHSGAQQFAILLAMSGTLGLGYVMPQ